MNEGNSYEVYIYFFERSNAGWNYIYCDQNQENGNENKQFRLECTVGI